MIRRTFPLGFGLVAAFVLPLAACDQQDESATSPTPEFESASEELPECCQPDDAIIDRTARAPGEAEPEADLQAPAAIDEATLAPNAPELVAQVGSIQTSVDESINGTLIGQKPFLDLTFTNEDGEEVNLARDYAGQTIVLSTIFTSCPTPTACPRITDDFADMANRLPDELADKVRFVLVSFDPANDTPQVLKIFGRKHGIDFDRVDLLVSDVPTTKRLMIDELSIPIELDAQTGNFANHALMAHVINKDGLIVVERTAGSSAKIAMLLDEAIRAVKLPFVAPDNDG